MLIRRLPRASPSWGRISEWDTSVCFEVPAQPRGLPTWAGIKLAGGRDGPAQATGTMRHAGSPPLSVFTQSPRMRVAQTGAGGSGKGAEGRVQARLRKGDRKGPAGGGVGASAASPSAGQLARP